MRSDRYKTSNLKTGMNEEDREDFWNGAAVDEHAEKPSAGQKAGSFIKSLIVDILIALCLAAAVLYFIRPTIVKQTSMENTLHENDYMIMYRQAYRNHDPERGDIIIFQSGSSDKCIYHIININKVSRFRSVAMNDHGSLQCRLP